MFSIKKDKPKKEISAECDPKTLTLKVAKEKEKHAEAEGSISGAGFFKPDPRLNEKPITETEDASKRSPSPTKR